MKEPGTMKTRKLLAGVATAALLLSLPMAAGPANLPFAATAAQAQEVRVSFNLFFDELEPHGVWVRHARYRYVWCPDVDVRWRPYTNGRWVYMKDYGWYFKSREPFAWAVYHYGRWFRDDRLGWCWVPGRNWAPAWVSWRHGGKVVGWAPLPPEELVGAQHGRVHREPGRARFERVVDRRLRQGRQRVLGVGRAVKGLCQQRCAGGGVGAGFGRAAVVGRVLPHSRACDAPCLARPRASVRRPPTAEDPRARPRPRPRRGDRNRAHSHRDGRQGGSWDA